MAFLASTPVPTPPEKPFSWGLQQLTLLNSRFNQKADKGKPRANALPPLETSIQTLNEGLSKVKTCGDLSTALSEFWVSIIFEIHPFSAGNAPTAKFLIIQSLRRFDLALQNPWLFEEFSSSQNFDEDRTQLSKAVLENLKIFDPIGE